MFPKFKKTMGAKKAIRKSKAKGKGSYPKGYKPK